MVNSIREYGKSSQQLKIYEEQKNNFTHLFPKEIVYKIFSYFNRQELATCLRVSKKWQVLASHEALWNALPPKIAFGKKQWETYFGDIGMEPPLPKDIYDILESLCPFWPGKKVKETHMLVLIPKTVNGEPLNLTSLEEFMKRPKKGHPTQYRYKCDEIFVEYGHQPNIQSHWVLMTKDVIEGSRNRNYTDQETVIAQFIKQAGLNYEISNILEAAICIFIHSIIFQEHLFGDKPGTYTYCQEEFKGWQLIIGGLSQDGLRISGNYASSNDAGVAPVRRFF